VSITGKALWYLESHLGGDVSLDTVAAVAGVSRFHLSRAFGAATGQPLSAYVRARRLSNAAKALAQGATDILAVALDSGYGSHEAFTRAFRQHFGITPEQLRAGAHATHLTLQEPIRMHTAAPVTLAPPRIVEHPALLIFGIGQRYHQTNAGIPSQWERFVPHIGHIQDQVGRAAYGVICNCDEAGSIDYITGVEVREFPSHPDGFTRLRIPPQTYAVFRHDWHVSTVQATWSAIWNHGLPESGCLAADGASFERYGEEFDGRTGQGGLEIWIPVRATLLAEPLRAECR
jgi:AraC family transcriptional regulator